MELHKIRPEDRAWIDPIVMAEKTHSTDFSCGSLVIWNDSFDFEVGRVQERLIIRSMKREISFFLAPIGSGPVAPAIRAMRDLCEAEGKQLVLYGVTEVLKARMEEELPGWFRYKEETDYSDYIYEIDALAELSGRKLHAKKNHVNKFLSLYPDWHFEPLTPARFEECRRLLTGWQTAHQDADGQSSIEEENMAIEAAFRHYEELELEGGVLYADGRICAFSIGEKCAADTFVVHFEKADRSVEGAYTMINREFVRQIRDTHPEVRYINREDDMGLESLRKAKRSYHPCFMEVKYSAYHK